VINTLRIYEELSEVMDPKPAQKLASVLGLIYEDLQNTVKRSDFEALQRVVGELAVSQKELAEAQKRTEARLQELTEAQNRTEARVEELTRSQKELAEAQRRTEARVEELARSQKELAEAQKRTEARVEELARSQKELAEAQKRTEARVEELARSQKELAEAQKRTEARVQELTEAQKRTEARLGELAEAQKRTEARVEELTRSQKELAEAQKRTESALAKLAERLDDTNKQLGGLAITVGFTLENEAYRALPVLLERDHQLKLTEPLRRDYLADAKGRDLEVNILGRGIHGSDPVWIIGEAKAQLSKNEVDRFIRNRVEPLKPVCGKVFPILVAHMVSSRDVPEYARQRGVALYLSYQFGQQ
jgi:myosin heavy subunit